MLIARRLSRSHRLVFLLIRGAQEKSRARVYVCVYQYYFMVTSRLESFRERSGVKRAGKGIAASACIATRAKGAEGLGNNMRLWRPCWQSTLIFIPICLRKHEVLTRP